MSDGPSYRQLSEVFPWPWLYRESVAPPRRELCPECGRAVAVKKNGALRHHVSNERDYPGSKWRRVCDGSGLLLPPSSDRSSSDA